MALFYTLAFILVFSLFSKEALERYLQQKAAFFTFTSSYEVQQKEMQDRQRKLFILSELRESKIPLNTTLAPKEKIAQTKSTEEPEKSSRGYSFLGTLNLYELLQESTTTQPKEELFLKLFDRLYSNQPFYTETLGKDLLDALRKIATGSEAKNYKKKNLKSVDDLALLSIDDPTLQKKLYKVLKGCQVEGKEGGYPSLYSYLTLRKRPSKINLYTAPYDLLAVLFDEKTAQYILEYRILWKKKSSEPVEPFRAQIMKEITNFYGKDFSKYQDLITFQTH